MPQPNPEVRIPAVIIGNFYAKVGSLLGGPSVHRLADNARLDLDLIWPSLSRMGLTEAGQAQLTEALGAPRCAEIRSGSHHRLGGVAVTGLRLYRPDRPGLSIGVVAERTSEGGGLEYNSGLRLTLSIPGLELEQNLRQRVVLGSPYVDLNGQAEAQPGGPLYDGLGAVSAITNVIEG